MGNHDLDFTICAPINIIYLFLIAFHSTATTKVPATVFSTTPGPTTNAATTSDQMITRTTTVPLNTPETGTGTVISSCQTYFSYCSPQ